MSESLEDLYKANETWEQALMLGSPKKRMQAMNQLFLSKKKLDQPSDVGKAIFYRDCSIKMALKWNK